MIKPEFQKTGHEAVKSDDKSGQPCRVLLVEDDVDDQFIEKKRLEASAKVGEVVCFSNGKELMDYMDEQGYHDRTVMCLQPTVIILDLNMPRVDGFEVLRQLKSDAFLAEIPVIVVSGDASYESIRRAHDLKADAFFKKPMNVYKLQTFLDRGWQWPTMEMWMR